MIAVIASLYSYTSGCRQLSLKFIGKQTRQLFFSNYKNKQRTFATPKLSIDKINYLSLNSELKKIPYNIHLCVLLSSFYAFYVVNNSCEPFALNKF